MSVWRYSVMGVDTVGRMQRCLIPKMYPRQGRLDNRLRLPLMLQTRRLFPESLSLNRRVSLHYSLPENSGQLPTVSVVDDPEICTDRMLEWDELCAHVCRFASTSAGKKACRNLKRGHSCTEALRLQSETRAVEVLSVRMRVDFDFGSLSTDVTRGALERSAKGGMLSGEHLWSLATLMSVAQGLKGSITRPFRKKGVYGEERTLAEVVYRPWADVEIDLELLNVITFAVDDDGSLKDNASEALAKARGTFKRIRARLEAIVRSFGGEMAERSGRICLVIPAGSQVPPNALILDAGSSGNVYCEPRSALTLNNELSVAYAEMKNAEETILWNLTSQVSESNTQLSTLLQMIVDLDAAIARYRYTEWIDGGYPQFSFIDEQDITSNEPISLFLSLINLRHPLLLGQSLIYEEANARRRMKDLFQLAPPVPNDVVLTSHTKALVITGPNAGGKTATLKALGLCALMAKAGLGLPAKQPVRIPFYSSVLADIGDEQSLTSSLSTFSGHLHRIQNLRRVADGKCLVLLDELGTGTDPKEGAALGVALLKALVKGGDGGALTTVVSTHHGPLKNLAYERTSDDGETEGPSVFENASMEFDDEALAPTYRLIMGVPGQSNALNIASRLGMDLRIIGAAKRRLGQQHISENALIAQIQDQQEELENISDRIEQLQTKTENVEALIRDAERRTAGLVYQQSTQQADDAMHAYERGKASLAVLKHEKELQASQSDVTAAMPELEASVTPERDPHWVPEIGDEVYVPDIGKSATLIKRTSKNKGVIRAGFLTITVELGTLQPL